MFQRQVILEQVAAHLKLGLHGLHFFGFTFMYSIYNQAIILFSIKKNGLQCKP